MRELTHGVREASRVPLLFGSDLERGAGQQFDGCTALPPLWALASLDDLETLWRAGELTAREARALGVEWIYAPVADLANEPRNPIVATRAMGSDPAAVARGVVAWSLGCLAGGGLPCAKHFPGHGRTLLDSHAGLPVVDASQEELAQDLVPFAAAVSAGVPSLMGAHVSYPALDSSGMPATRSAAILTDLLRSRMGFQGVVVSDALIMEGAAMDTTEGAAGVEAVRAGIDALLYPKDVAHLAAALDDAPKTELPPARVKQALRRLQWMSGLLRPGGRAAPTGFATWGRDEDRRWARETALRTVRLLAPLEGPLPWPYTVVTIDDDLGGPYPVPSRYVFPDTLRGLGVEVTFDVAREPLSAGSDDSVALAPGGSRLIAVYADVRAWKGRVGLSEGARRRIAEAIDGADAALVVLFSHPWNAEGLAAPVMCAWGGEPIMQEAAARAVARLGSG